MSSLEIPRWQKFNPFASSASTAAAAPDAGYDRFEDDGASEEEEWEVDEARGVLGLVCPCLRSKRYGEVAASEDVRNPVAGARGGGAGDGSDDASRAGDAGRGTWLDEGDELAQSCFQCGSEFHPVRNRRHHCRRCGDTYCIDCSARYQPLLLSGLDQPQRVCDECYDGAGADNAFAQRHAPVLSRGAILQLRGGLFGGKTAVVLRVANGELLFLDQSSVESAPRLAVRLDQVSAVAEKGTGLVVKYGLSSAAHLESQAPRPDLAAAIRAAAKRASAPTVRARVDERRWKKRQARRDAAARSEARSLREARSADRQSIREKYGLRRGASD